MLLTSARALDVFIKNQPFEGKVLKEASTLWLELTPLEKALGFQAVVHDEGAEINGKLVRTLKQGNTLLISLPQVAALLSLAVRDNPSLGTVDVYTSLPNHGAGDLTSIDVQTSSPANAETPILTAAYRFTIPKSLKVTRNPQVLDAYSPQKAASQALATHQDALVFHDNDRQFQRGAALFSWASDDIPAAMKDPTALLRYQQELSERLMIARRLTPITSPEIVDNDGQAFVLSTGLSTEGSATITLILLRIDPKKKRLFSIVCRGIPKDDHQALENFVKLLSQVTTR